MRKNEQAIFSTPHCVTHTTAVILHAAVKTTATNRVKTDGLLTGGLAFCTSAFGIFIFNGLGQQKHYSVKQHQQGNKIKPQ
ncbi:MAG TPA: hypothetical protein VD905_09530 [Flavobacteriales bacterium]|nr:hypothetical protein [Flavobacteriales bacterium]